MKILFYFCILHFAFFTFTFELWIFIVIYLFQFRVFHSISIFFFFFFHSFGPNGQLFNAYDWIFIRIRVLLINILFGVDLFSIGLRKMKGMNNELTHLILSCFYVISIDSFFFFFYYFSTKYSKVFISFYFFYFSVFNRFRFQPMFICIQ